MKKVIFIDLDGTLRNSQKQISTANIEAIKLAKSAGYEIIPATGRPYEYGHEINDQAGEMICRYIISSTGSIVYDLQQKEIVAVATMPAKAITAICNLLSPGSTLLLHCADGLFTTGENDDNGGVSKQIDKPLDQFIKTKIIGGMTVASLNFDLIEQIEKKVNKLHGIHISNRHKALTDKSFERTGIAYFDVIAKGVSKGYGIKTFCKLHGIPKNQRTAIGDDLNDLSMFAVCKTSVAMGNALPIVKKAATQTTSDNNSDGVAKFLLALLETRT